MAWIFTSDGNYVNFNGGGNLWRLHKDSACISWHWDESGDLFFDVYDQEYTVKAGSIADVIIDGVPLSAASDFPTAIRAVFTGLASGGSLGYLVYTALVSQTSTDAPVVDFLLENTLGVTPSWTYDGTGIYSAIAAPILAAKTFVIITMGVGVGFARILQGGIDAGQDGYITVKSYDAAGNAADLGGAKFQIEIRVYP